MATEQASHHLHVLDYLIFGATLLVSLGIGLYHAFSGGHQRTTKEYFLGNRNMKTIPVALSILVSFVSAILVLGTPAEMYTRGTQMVMRTFGYCLAIILSSILLVPLFYGLQITSTFEYLERRYGSATVKLFGTTVMILGNILYMGLVIYTPSTALAAVTGIPVWLSILASGLVAALYTAVGGMRAVVWTDVFQSVIMIIGMLAIVIQGSIKVGGLGKVWEVSQRQGRIIFFDFNPDPTERLSFWSLVVGGMFSSLGIFGIGQASVQRYCALPTLSKARCSLFLNIPGLVIVNILASLVGLVIFAYYNEIGCDPLKEGYISNQNQLVPYFVVDVLNYPGFPGIFLAVLFSGALSSMSSVLNSLSAVTWQDILSYWFGHLPEIRKALITKLTVIVYGALAMVMAFLTDGLGINVLQASITFSGASMGPSLGLFLVGALFPFVNAAGAMIGCGTALALCLWIVSGNFIYRQARSPPLPTVSDNCLLNSTLTNWTLHENYTAVPAQILHNVTSSSDREMSGLHWLYGLSFLWYCAIGTLVTLIIGPIASLIVRKISRSEQHKVDPSLIIPVVDYVWWCLPASWRRGLSEHQTKHKPYTPNPQILDDVEADIKLIEVSTSANTGEEARSILSESRADQASGDSPCNGHGPLINGHAHLQDGQDPPRAGEGKKCPNTQKSTALR